MELTKQQLASAKKAYELYWDSYMRGDKKTFVALLDAKMQLIGTTEDEIFHNKKQVVDFYHASVEQVAGKVEFKNRKIKITSAENHAQVTELSDIYLLDRKDWIFYSKIRMTTWLRQSRGKWKVFQQHGSLPDTRTQAGETLAAGQIKKENRLLREAVQRRTAELENKNRELEIESALERVRSIAMGMKDRVDMLKICKTISLQLAKLGVKEIRNVQTAIFNVPKGTYMNYEFYAKHDKTFITATTYTDHKVARAFAAKMLKGKGEVSITYIKGREKVKEWLNYQKGTNVFIDTYLNTATSLTYYWYSLGPVALGISTYTPLTKDEQELFSRFLKVFELAYRRYLDIERAEAQAREAQIEASLEKVRAQALGMRKPEELTNICEVLFKELKHLGFTELRNSMINIHDDDKKTFVNYDYSDEIGKSITPLYYNIHPVIKKQIKQIRSADDAFSETVFKGRDLASWKAFRKSRGEKEDKRIKNSTALYYYFYSIGTGSIGISTFNAINEEKQELLKRFRNVFVFAHRRYMDVAQAEAQAREAQIEAALERVRAASMAMQDSSALSGIIYKLYGELTKLDAKLDRCFIMIVNPENKGITWWMAGQEGLLAENGFFVQMNQHPSHLMYLDNCKRRKKKWTYLFEGKEKRDWDRFGFSKTELARLPEPVKKFMSSAKKVHLSGSSDQFGSLVTGSFEPLPEEQQDIISRFSIAFNQAYIRFLDLQKAEAQAREAKIEAALERVRSRTMAMHQTSELQEVIHTVHNELLNLNLSIDGGSFVVINDDVGPELRCWGSGGTANTSEEVQVPHFNMPFCTDLIKDIKKGPGFFTEEFSQNEKKKYFTKLFEHKPWSDLSSEQKKETLSSSGGYTRSVAVSKHTSIFIINHHGRKFTEGENNILKRFAKVFEQTYTRFLDLQKAEAQAREAKIEAGLERVRSRSLAMHKSEELLEVVTVIFEQLRTLGLQLWNCGIFRFHSKQSSDAELWMTRPDGKMMGQSFVIPLDKVPVYKKLYEAWKNMEEFHIESLQGIDIINHHNSIASLNIIPVDKMKQAAGRALPRQMFFHSINFSDGILGAITTEAVEDETLLLRFGNTFKQSYTRFLDLQRAEAQAKEAQIEASLERVRSRTMAMQKSDELLEAGELLCSEMNRLGISSLTSGYVLMDADEKIGWNYTPNPGTGKIMPAAVGISHVETAEMQRVLERWKNKEPFSIIGMDEEQTIRHQTFIAEQSINFPLSAKELLAISPKKIVLHNFNFKEGYILIVGGEKLTEEQIEIMLRFTNVFQQTYTRFLDLQKAEAQAREAKIEAALEKVRSRTMAMQRSEELGDVATVLFKELNQLVTNLWTCGFVLCEKDRTEDEWWLCTEGGFIPAFYLPNVGDRVHENLYKAWKDGKTYHTEQVEGEELGQHYEWLMSIPVAKKIFDDFASAGFEKPTWQKLHGAYFSKGYLCIITREPCPEEDIFKRFAQVFDLTYTRFLDLQKAEAQAKEAQIETALEKVRSRTMAMQSSNELQETATVLFNEFKKLGTENIYQVTIGIYNEDEGLIDFRVTSWAGSGTQESRSFKLDMNEPTVLQPSVQAWKANKKSLVIDLSGEALEGWLSYRNKMSGITVSSADTAGRRVISIAYYSKGHLSISTPVPVPADTLRTLERFAAVFDSTYTRFLDLKKAEAQAMRAEQDLIAIKEAKQKAEEALTELQATQKQLIQSEKMASLGELTAGIAHEIQNPLNFVNNFSEVSKELLDEMKEAIEKGDAEEAKEIMNDVIQNLEKINHHGKRADGIVKGMLQHSRTSSNQKEATDINALADEYLRLAYHGLRAKDKSFNATMKTDFDETIGNINIIPQDIGRVILNLITNAFYVVNEKKTLRQAQGDNSYEPIVSVSTKKDGNLVFVSVKDNGNGIPQKILDKIFQPFFTTKPTGQGTGLGLSLSYDIVKAHGGELKVETKEGEGSEFTIQLQATG